MSTRCSHHSLCTATALTSLALCCHGAHITRFVLPWQQYWVITAPWSELRTLVLILCMHKTCAVGWHSRATMRTLSHPSQCPLRDQLVLGDLNAFGLALWFFSGRNASAGLIAVQCDRSITGNIEVLPFSSVCEGQSQTYIGFESIAGGTTL